MTWWESWCIYVHFFHPYKGIEEQENNALKRKICEVDVANARILQHLPPGATLPPFLEREKKEVLGQNAKKDKKSDSSSSSDESSIDSGTDEHLVPAAMDNTLLIFDRKGNWHMPNLHVEQDNSTKGSNGEGNESNVLLKSNLVRGHHFEILPREAYAAIRSWYGEASSPIMRRVQSVDDIPWLSNNNPANHKGSNSLSVRLTLYADRWDTIRTRNEEIHNNFFVCCACRAPFARSKCTKCGCARYCSKGMSG
jgi:ubiquitin carboxyl-terminal hydrolase 4/11/15